MGDNKDKAMEAQISKAVPKAVKQLIQDLDNEPTLVIELNDNEVGAPEETMSDMRTWLFRRR
jgi:beta-galactosidase/beta-glucuronidase